MIMLLFQGVSWKSSISIMLMKKDIRDSNKNFSTKYMMMAMGSFGIFKYLQSDCWRKWREIHRLLVSFGKVYIFSLSLISPCNQAILELLDLAKSKLSSSKYYNYTNPFYITLRRSLSVYK